MGSGFDSLSPSKMKVFTGRSNPELAQGISDYLGISLGNIDIQELSDGEIWVEFLPVIPFQINLLTGKDEPDTCCYTT